MKPAQAAKSESPWAIAALVVVSFTLLVLLVSSPLLVRTFLFQPFNITAGSMMPTLRVGDYLFVAKYAYGYGRYASLFSPPLFSGRLLASEPARGDVVALLLPRDNATVYIKRVVGLPGERIQMREGVLYINGVAVRLERLPDFVGGAPCGETSETSVAATKRWRETLPNGVSHEILDCVDNGFYDNTNIYTVPDGHYFVLGDNRDNSTDSRVLSSLGYVPVENIIGRAGMIFYSIGANAAGAGSAGRIGMMVR
jgi:signal peptidase I